MLLVYNIWSTTEKEMEFMISHVITLNSKHVKTCTTINRSILKKIANHAAWLLSMVLIIRLLC